MDPAERDIRSALDRGTGMKVLLLDEFTREALSPLVSHSELLSKDFFLFELIGSERPCIEISCVAIIRPESISRLCAEVASPRYREYFVFITNEVSEEEIALIAQSDERCVVRELQELYMDYIPVDSKFLTTRGSPQLAYRDARALASFFMGAGLRPCSRYLFGSEGAYRVAKEIQDTFESRGPPNCHLLVLSRTFDLFTPLQYTWTYQAMAAEYLSYRNGVIRWGDKTLSVSSQDAFFLQNKFSDIVKATGIIRDSLKEVRETRNLVSKDFVTSLRQRARTSEKLILHLQALTAISKGCIDNDDISEVEAAIVRGHEADLDSALAGDLTSRQKLKLLLVLLLSQKIPRKGGFRGMIRGSPQDAHLPSAAREYDECLEAFRRQYLEEKVHRRRPRYNEAIDTKLGYVPPIKDIAEKWADGSLSHTHYPALNKAPADNSVLVIFIMGGATYLEYKATQELASAKRRDIILVTDRIITYHDILSSLNAPM